MNRYASAAILFYALAAVAQALTWTDLGSAERSSRIVLFLLAASILAAILASRAGRD